MKVLNEDPIDILLVEDNEADIKITLRAFDRGRLRNNIHVVRDGQEALDYVYHEGQYQDRGQYPVPDLILLDINMPKANGFEVLQKIKNDPKLRYIPVAMLTSSKNDEDIVRSYGYGACSYIQKPVDFTEFIKLVDGFNFYWHIINKLPEAP